MPEIFHRKKSRTFYKNGVMDNFMCQLGLAIVHRYMVKHCSRCFCEGIFFRSEDPNKVDYAP